MATETPILDRINEARVRIVRAFSSMPGGASLFVYANCQEQTEVQFNEMTARNLEALRDSLKHHYKLHQEQFDELMQLQQQRRAFRNFLGTEQGAVIGIVTHGNNAECPSVLSGSATHCPGHEVKAKQ